MGRLGPYLDHLEVKLFFCTWKSCSSCPQQFWTCSQLPKLKRTVFDRNTPWGCSHLIHTLTWSRHTYLHTHSPSSNILPSTQNDNHDARERKVAVSLTPDLTPGTAVRQLMFDLKEQNACSSEPPFTPVTATSRIIIQLFTWSLRWLGEFATTLPPSALKVYLQ